MALHRGGVERDDGEPLQGRSAGTEGGVCVELHGAAVDRVAERSLLLGGRDGRDAGGERGAAGGMDRDRIHNQKSPGTFIGVGSAQSGGLSSYPPIAVTVNVAGNAGSPLVNAVSVSGGGSASATGMDSTVILVPVPVLSVTSTHSGNFIQGQSGAAYTVTVSNQAGAGATTGTVTVIETVPSGLTLASMSGTGWSCTGNTCTRSDVLSAGSSYPAIAVTANVAANAGSPLMNSVSVSGGGSAMSMGTDSTVVTAAGAERDFDAQREFHAGANGSRIHGDGDQQRGGPTTGTVTVTDTVPGGLTLVSMSGTEWSCTGNTCTRSDALGTGGGASWYSSSWAYRKPGTISHLQVSGSSALANFPALISLPGDAGLQSFAQGNGNDILFTDATGTVKLNHEIEQYNAATGQLTAWVEIPSLSPTADTAIYMYYGNGAAGNQQNAAGVWSGTYRGVWHLSNNAGLNVSDSTGNGNNGTVIGTGTGIATGEISGGQSFNGSSYENVGSSALLNVTGPLTVAGG